MLACISRVSNGSTAITIFTGIFLAIVPAVTFSKLQMKTTTKIGVSIVMAFTLLYYRLCKSHLRARYYG